MTYLITTNGIKITIKKETTHKEILPEPQIVEQFEEKDLEELKKDPTLQVYQDALEGAYAEINEVMNGETTETNL